jgi:ketopantoate hydroxymethyltransferase
MRFAAPGDLFMAYPNLHGVSMAFEETGAHLTTTNTLKHAKTLVEHDGLTAVMLDHALSDGDGTSLATRLTERGIPFMLHCGSSPSTARTRTRRVS